RGGGLGVGELHGLQGEVRGLGRVVGLGAEGQRDGDGDREGGLAGAGELGRAEGVLRGGLVDDEAVGRGGVVAADVVDVIGGAELGQQVVGGRVQLHGALQVLPGGGEDHVGGEGLLVAGHQRLGALHVQGAVAPLQRERAGADLASGQLHLAVPVGERAGTAEQQDEAGTGGEEI